MNADETTFFLTDESWRAAHPGAHAGILVIKDIDNVANDEKIDELTQEIERELREKYAGFSRDDFNAIPVIAAYNDYYKKFGKTYHVRPQVESIVGGKSLPKISALLSSMFGMEVKNMLLTAGHDLDLLLLPLTIKSADGIEEYVGINGKPKKTEAGDMMMADAEGIVSSIVQGPDSRTKITADTNHALFAVYAPAGIEKNRIHAHLENIRDAVLLFSPAATVAMLTVFDA